MFFLQHLDSDDVSDLDVMAEAAFLVSKAQE
jgi:hypothetical protein